MDKHAKDNIWKLKNAKGKVVNPDETSTINIMLSYLLYPKNTPIYKNHAKAEISGQRSMNKNQDKAKKSGERSIKIKTMLRQNNQVEEA